MAFELPDLPYDYNALEPHIDARTMEIHHGKHHAGYTKKLNAALEKAPELQDKDIVTLLKDVANAPDSVRTAIRNQGGGYYNHLLFWEVMGPNGGGDPQGALAEAINSAFGDFASFKEKFSAAAAGRFGSGWAWLCVESGGKLAVCSTPNQDNPLMQGIADHQGTPILGLDVWEHAYYLKYQNRRPDYIAEWWNVVNWAQVAKNYEAAK